MNDHEETEDVDERPRQLVLDQDATSTDLELPAFLAKPEGAPVYHGFPVVLESMTDGWYLGVITEYLDPDGCDSGDAYVIAPDGSRAGLVWDVGNGDVEQICAPDHSRWGVYQIWFPKQIRTTEDLVECFRGVLPQLKEVYNQIKKK